MSTLAIPARGFGRRPAKSLAAAPDLLARLRRVVREPEPWTMSVLVTAGALVLLRHPLASALGTAEDLVGSAAPPAAAARPAAAAPYVPPVTIVPTHAPRDPFQAWVNARGALVVPTTPGRPSAAVVPATACAVTRVVQPGDSVWALAAQSVPSGDPARIDRATDRIYAANRSIIGPNPALVQPGMRLCIPRGL